jgi:hypothetical protein
MDHLISSVINSRAVAVVGRCGAVEQSSSNVHAWASPLAMMNFPAFVGTEKQSELKANEKFTIHTISQRHNDHSHLSTSRESSN